MPLFGSAREPSPPPPPPEPERHGLFGRKRQSTPPVQESHDDGVQRRGSMFSRSSAGRTSPTGTASTNRTGGGFFSLHRGSNSDSSGELSHVGNDPSIIAAKQKVNDAERFEREADHALSVARSAVREARDHVRMLEHEALEEARRAKQKQQEAKNVSKSAKHLGRHG
ncbi:hypothetical protein OF83DRAFT_1052224 [Amylostereum chailletii]|nr:hypothetical protein OF83DRAFT_1052224 [Amylostereum chailletii]